MLRFYILLEIGFPGKNKGRLVPSAPEIQLMAVPVLFLFLLFYLI
jgi:hypothetical protein